MTSIVISPVKTTWQTDFAALKLALSQVCPRGARLHHIGSTAVSGLAAKDVIDIQMTVGSLNSVDDAALAAAGFRRKFGLSDHSTPGLALAPIELRKRFYNHLGRPANLHVREAGRFNQRYALLCRDFLRAHDDAAQAYALIKQRLAQRFPDDAEAYYDIKDPVFDIIMAGANEWAERTGWREPPAD